MGLWGRAIDQSQAVEQPENASSQVPICPSRQPWCSCSCSCSCGAWPASVTLRFRLLFAANLEFRNFAESQTANCPCIEPPNPRSLPIYASRHVQHHRILFLHFCFIYYCPLNPRLGRPLRPWRSHQLGSMVLREYLDSDRVNFLIWR